jgi:hypothetical protein
MRLATLMIACLGTAFWLLGPVGADPGPTAGGAPAALAREDASAILDAYVQAAGGDGLERVTAEMRKGTLLRSRAGQVPLEIAAKAPGMWRYEQTFAWGDGICYGCDGANGWVQDTARVTPMTARQKLDLQLLCDVQAPLKLREWFPQMRATGTEQHGDTLATTVVATTGDGLSLELAFDTATHLLVRAGDLRFEDYRDVGSVRRPYRVRLGEDAGEAHLAMTMTFSEIRHDVDLPDGLFASPDCVLPMAKPPLYTRRTQIEADPAALEACVGVYQHPEKADVTYTVTRQGSHLMLTRSGWNQTIEIKPESPTDYFVKFLNWEFHFIKGESGEVVRLAVGADRAIQAERIH